MEVLIDTNTTESDLATLSKSGYAHKLPAALLRGLYSRENPTHTPEETYIVMFTEALPALVEKSNNLIILL